jgi:hypothetical protein
MKIKYLHFCNLHCQNIPIQDGTPKLTSYEKCKIREKDR